MSVTVASPFPVILRVLRDRDAVSRRSSQSAFRRAEGSSIDFGVTGERSGISFGPHSSRKMTIVKGLYPARMSAWLREFGAGFIRAADASSEA
ncbi:hypothetical protein [Mycobacterium arosiense]|uniref:hypothetical protein n=1 Tax=Mycobacterium arosiense TaxID=425468 RepID=UPI00114E8B7D|nr:hypothetical protein [Mycobacterium arosiense]